MCAEYRSLILFVRFAHLSGSFLCRAFALHLCELVTELLARWKLSCCVCAYRCLIHLVGCKHAGQWGCWC